MSSSSMQLLEPETLLERGACKTKQNCTSIFYCIFKKIFTIFSIESTLLSFTYGMPQRKKK